jgi:hypothetical protein
MERPMKKIVSFFILVLVFFASAQASFSSQDITGGIPLYFISNQGQVHKDVKFYAQTPGYTLWLTRNGLFFDGQAKTSVVDELTGEPTGTVRKIRDVSWIEFAGANKKTLVEATDQTAYKVNFLKGNHNSWQTNVETFQTVIYRNIYENIDLKVYGTERRIEYDWIIKAGSDPENILVNYKNVKEADLDEDGNLVLKTMAGQLVHKKPMGYQIIAGRTVPVDVA